MQAETVLLEPLCRFSLRIPADALGRIVGELSRIQARCLPPEADDDALLVRGEAVYSRFMAFQQDFASITRGRGALSVVPAGAVPCPDPDAVMAAHPYDPCADDTPGFRILRARRGVCRAVASGGGLRAHAASGYRGTGGRPRPRLRPRTPFAAAAGRFRRSPLWEVWRAEALQRQSEPGDIRGGFGSLAQQGFPARFPGRAPRRRGNVSWRKRPAQRPFPTSWSGRKPLPLSCSGRALRAEENFARHAKQPRESAAARISMCDDYLAASFL